MTDFQETQALLIDLAPAFIFLSLQTIFYLYSRLSNQPPKEEDQESIADLLNEKTEDDKFLTVGYYVQCKLAILLSLLYLFEVPYALFLASSNFWIYKNDILIYIYILPAFSWLLSLKLIKTDRRGYTLNLQIFWLLTFFSNVLALVFWVKGEGLVVMILKLVSSFVLVFYALIKDLEEKNKRGKTPKKCFFQVVEQIISKFEENFYVRVIFLGKDYERFLRKEIELIDIDAHSQMNMNLSFSDIKKKEKAFVKKLAEKNYLNELEEQEFLSYLPSIQILIWKEPAKSLPNVIKNYDPKLFFVVYSYLTWDLDNRMEFKIYRKLSEFIELEKKLNEFYLERPFFNRPQIEFQRFSLEDCEFNDELLYKKRALTLERFFNFVLLKERHLIHPLILDFLEVSAEEKKPFQAYYNFLIKQKIVRSPRRPSRRPRGTNATIDSPLLTENLEEDFVSQSSSFPLIPMNYLLFEVRLISIWKFPNEPLESNITLGITEKSINYDWEITRKFMDFINLHNALKAKSFKDEPEYQANSQKITPLLQVKANTLNYFFNFEVIKKDLIDYLTYLVTNSQYHCTELFNFIEFDPNAMKRFVLGRNLNKFLLPTQTVRTFTNESHLGIRQHCSILSYADPQNTGSKAFITQNTNNFGNNPPSLARINTNFNSNSRGIPPLKSYKRTYTNQQPTVGSSKFEMPYIIERNVHSLNLQNFFANVTELKKNSENEVSLAITLNEYMEDKITKVKRRVMFEKSKFEIRQLFETVMRFCEANGVAMSVPLRNIEILDDSDEENMKNGVEIYLNEVIKLPSISKLKEVLQFFFFDRIKLHFQDSDQKMMVLDLREK